MPEATEAFAAAVLAGLGRPRKLVPARFSYDARGSALFEAITALPEYYPTRTEVALLARHGAAIAALAGRGRAVVEFGAGSAAKTPLLLRHMAAAAYVPVDISGEFLRRSAAALAAAHPGLAVLPLVADFTAPLALPAAVAGRPMLGFFPGSTIGNLAPAAAVDLLRGFRATLGADARLLIGIDRRKDPARLIAAYDDAAGVTAAFNLNLLRRINRELGGDAPIEAFAHRALWNDARGRVEMHLEATRDLTFSVAGQVFAMRAGETIHTENSYKYRPEEADFLGRAAGWEPVAAWVDDEALFGLHLWADAGDRPEP